MDWRRLAFSGLKILFTIITTLFILTSCTLSDKHIKKYWWNYGEGYWLGDVLTFDANNLKNDTLFMGGKPTAVIVSKINGYFGADNELVIKSLATGERGTYHEK